MKMVYCFNVFSIFICQNPNLRSRQEKCPALPNSQMPPGSWAKARSPFSCMHLGGRKLMHNHKPPVFCLTNTTCIAPCTLARLDSTPLQHLLEMASNFLDQRWGNLPKSFLKGSVICHFNCVFNRMSTA